MDIIELIEIYEDRIIFDCESDKTKIAVYKKLLKHIKDRLNK